MPSYFLPAAQRIRTWFQCHKIYCISTQLKKKSDVLKLSTPPTGLTLGAKEELLF